MAYITDRWEQITGYPHQGTSVKDIQKEADWADQMALYNRMSRELFQKMRCEMGTILEPPINNLLLLLEDLK
jgi:hypothetical protein